MSAACGHCGKRLNDSLPFCEHCGVLQARDAAYECETHADRTAIGMCAVCYKPLCETCKTTSGVKMLCDDPAHREMVSHWSVVHYADSEFEADAIRQNLKAAEIESKIFSLHDHVALHFLSIDRAAVWVTQQELQKAIAVLSDLNLMTIIES